MVSTVKSLKSLKSSKNVVSVSHSLTTIKHEKEPYIPRKKDENVGCSQSSIVGKMLMKMLGVVSTSGHQMMNDERKRNIQLRGKMLMINCCNYA